MKYFLLALLFSFSLNSTQDISSTSLKDQNTNIPISMEETIEGEANSMEIAISNETMALSSSYPVIYDTYREAYFRGLTVNIGKNDRNSCGYVALGQLLSYYDSYLNDNIIPEQYDVIASSENSNFTAQKNSPGILNDNIDNVSTMSSEEYYETIFSLKDVSLHAKLITIGEAKGYYNYDDFGNECLTTNSKRETILRAYLQERGITGYTISSASDTFSLSNPPTTQEKNTLVREFVKENIDLGYPVLLAAKRSTTSDIGHAMICYDYNGSLFYGNNGWSGNANNPHMSITSTYPIFTDAMVLKFNTEHTHSYNYEVVKSGQKVQYCYCNSNILTYTSEWNKFDEPINFDGNLVVPNWVTSIGEEVFLNYDDLKSVTFEANSCLESIGYEAFGGCINLKRIVFPANLITIGNSSFAMCTGLTSATFEADSQLKTIEAYAFQGCTGLTTFSIPNTVTTIGWSPFISCNTMRIYTNKISCPTGWDATWNVSFVDYDAMMQDAMNGVVKEDSAYYAYHIIYWNG